MHRCSRKLCNSTLCSVFGNELVLHCVPLVRTLTTGQVNKLNSVLVGFSSDTNLIKDKKNSKQELEITNFKILNKTAGKLNKSQDRENSTKNCQMFIPGSGAVGALKCMYFRSAGTGYLFNSGENIQRIFQRGISLSKLRNVFITNLEWGNVGGFPGLAKTIYKINEQTKSKFVIKIHGPPGLKQLHDVLRSLIYLKDQEIEFVDTTQDKLFDDGVLRVKSVPLYHTNQGLVAENAIFNQEEEFNEMKANSAIETMIEHFFSFDYYGFLLKTEAKLGSKIKDIKLLTTDAYRNQKASVCYVCKTKRDVDRLNLEACVDRGVPTSLLWKLKNGEDVTLPNGEVVHFTDVSISGSPEATFAIVDCPNEGYIDSLLTDPTFKKFQSATLKEDTLMLIVHFSPPSVMNHPKYVKWMKSFPSVTKHLRINEDNNCIGYVQLHSLQTKLNLLHEEIFPKIPNPSIPVVSVSEYEKIYKNFNFDQKGDVSLYKIEKKIREMEHQVTWEPLENIENDVLEGKSRMIIDIKSASLGADTSFVLCPEMEIQEALGEKGAVEALKNLKEETEEMERDINQRTEGDYPKFLFLGTGSGQPLGLRNTSGILVFTDENSCILLDCGEGTYNRLNIFYGNVKTEEVLLKLKAVYISHMHSDHHFGLIEIIKGRRRAINNFLLKNKYEKLPEYQNLSKAEIVSKLNIKPLYLLGPYRMLDWLNFYDIFYEKLKSDFNFIPNGTFVDKSNIRVVKSLSYKKEEVEKSPSPEVIASFFREAGLSELKTCIVKHCFNSFGLSFKTNNGYKVSYSGDCMPTRAFIDIGSKSDLLIHEATFENDLSEMAKIKKHSTVGQAIVVAKHMKAKFTMLTHFSQRYRYIPMNTETFPNNVGISFDFMTFSMKQLPLLPKFLPMLRIIFEEDLEKQTSKLIRKKLWDASEKKKLFAGETQIKKHK